MSRDRLREARVRLRGAPSCRRRFEAAALLCQRPIFSPEAALCSLRGIEALFADVICALQSQQQGAYGAQQGYGQPQDGYGGGAGGGGYAPQQAQQYGNQGGYGCVVICPTYSLLTRD